ncbi:MAG: isochorismatase family protein [Fuerstiella sp.]|nr:isochorismatase family protein [Fuerstiella sp.]
MGPGTLSRRTAMVSSLRLVMVSCGIATVAVLIACARGRAENSPDESTAAGTASERTLHIKPRYYRWHVDPGEEWVEKNTGYAHLDWEVTLSRVALVLVDVWDRHYIEDTESRSEEIVQQKIRPLLNASRRAGVEIIHAPSPREARLYKAWNQQRYPVQESSLRVPQPAAKSELTWPPVEFRSKAGPYKKYARPFEPMAAVRLERLKGMRIHPDVEPVGDEVVVANGAELHQYCREKGILFLIYLGFNTNACILTRDYGTLEMGKRGYEIIILRDCTTAMESFETADELLQTRGAIQFLEMFGKYSITSQELIAGLPDSSDE